MKENLAGKLRARWGGMSGLEKVAVVGIGVASASVVAMALMPNLAAATIGGGLTAAGGYLLRTGFRAK